MMLQKFLEKSDMSQKEFAKKIGRTQVTVSRLCSGVSRPSLNLAFKIERETDGAVAASSWVESPSPQRGAA